MAGSATARLGRPISACETDFASRCDCISAWPVAPTCAEPCVVEEFDGQSLASPPWTVVRPSGNLTVSGGSVKIPMEATDLYQTTNTARVCSAVRTPRRPSGPKLGAGCSVSARVRAGES